MPNMALRPNAHNTVPDDPELSTYRFIIISAKRARQLQAGARSFLPTSTKKPTVSATEEVRRGLITWTDPGRPVEEGGNELI